MIKICTGCGKEFETKNQRIFKCNICVNEYQREKLIEKSKLFFKDASTDDFVVCQICGLHSINIATHIVRTHSMTTEEYKNLYNSEVVCKSFLESQSERMKGEKNPGYQHDGKFSPFSEKFIKGDVREETQKKANETREKNNSYTSRIEYYTSRGMDEDEARQALIERQTTFSKDGCIKKYGEKEGMKIWMERQKKWLNSLNKNLNNGGMDFLKGVDLSKLINSDEFVHYRNQVQKYTKNTLERFKNVIDPDNLLENKDYEIDHKLSRLHGFLYDISPEIMSCRYNLQILKKDENLRKGANSTITLEDLLNYYNSSEL